MYRPGLLVLLWAFVRSYLVPILLLATLTAAIVQVYTTGTPPVPQEPPEGYVVQSGRVDLEWNRGTRLEPIQLQVSIDDPKFTKPAIERSAPGASYSLGELQPGHVYYWRLVQGEKAGPTASFETSKYYVNL
jgi:hypothetical protein